MSDRSLMNDSPICIDVETPISEGIVNAFF